MAWYVMQTHERLWHTCLFATSRILPSTPMVIRVMAASLSSTDRKAHSNSRKVGAPGHVLSTAPRQPLVICANALSETRMPPSG